MFKLAYFFFILSKDENVIISTARSNAFHPPPVEGVGMKGGL